MAVRLPLSVCESVDSVGVWGPDRIAVNLVAYAVAASSERHLLWLDTSSPNPSPSDDPFYRIVRRSRHYRLRSPQDLAPSQGTPDLSGWILSRPGEEDRETVRLADFLRLPPSVQNLVTEAPEERRGSVLLATNADRFSALYPESETGSRRYLDALKGASVKVVSSLTGVARPDRFASDHVFHVVPDAAGRWQQARLVAEKGGSPLPKEGGVPLGEVLEIAEIVAAR